MKAFSFKSNKVTIRVLKEPVLKKKRMNIDRVLYLTIIAVGVFFLLRYVFTKTAIIKANGQVLMDKVDVNFTHDIRLLKFNVFEGDTIQKEQYLFQYVEDQFDNDAVTYFSDQENRENKAKKELDLKFKIKAQRIKIKALRSNLKVLLHEKEKTSKMVLLDVFTIDKLNELTTKTENLNTEIALAKSELALLYEQLRYIKDHSNILLLGNASVNSNYRAPIDGIIGQISVSENETCYRTEKVLTIHNPKEVFIKAYFDLNEIKNIEVNDELTIEFPDKTKSIGVINKYYVSTYALPEEFQKTYEPTERSIVVEVKPLNEVERNKWATYHKLNIKISKYRF